MNVRRIHNLLRLSFVVMLLALPGYARGQQHSFKLFSLNDGLTSPIVGNAYQDKYGYLWLCTVNGPSRYDGRQFVNYSTADGLPSVTTTNFFQDGRDRLWVGTTDGMVQFKNNRFTTYPTSDNQYSCYVFNFLETKNKQIWALTNHGIYEFADTRWKKITLCPGFENKQCRNIIETNGELYVNYSEYIAYRNRAGAWQIIATSILFNVLSLHDGHILVSGEGNLYEIRDQKLMIVCKNVTPFLGHFSYLVDAKKRLWLSGERFLKVSEPGDWRYFTDLGDGFDHHNFLTEDSNHNIWTGTGEGLLRIRDIAFSITDDKNKLIQGIYNIIPLPDNRLILSSGTKSGLVLYNNGAMQQIDPPKAPGNENYYWDPVDFYTFDGSNTLWMFTRFRRFLHFNGKTLEDFSNLLNFKTGQRVYDIAYIKKRNQFFICADSTLLYGNSKKINVFIPKNTGVPIVKPTRMCNMENGLIILYIDGRGVYYIDESNNLISLIKETGIDGTKRERELGIGFYQDNAGSFWVTIPGFGLFEYGFNKSRVPFLKNHITTQDGLQSNDAINLRNDLQNRIWVATNSGVDILQKNRSGNWEVFNYVKTGDLTISAIHSQKLVRDAKGDLWLSSPDKIVRFEATDIRLEKERPHIAIEKIALAFKETDWSKLTDSLDTYFRLPHNPVLNYGQNSLGIFFNAVDFSTSYSSPEYSYQLFPLNTSWSIPSKTKSVSFAQLPPGTYKFMVRAKDGASGWSNPAIFRFTITPPFWARWWFRGIIVVCAALLIIVVFRARIKKIKGDAFNENQLKQLEMKALRAQMNPHFIYNALNSIQALVSDNKKTEGIHYIGSFSRLLRQVLDNSENNVISLDNELETIGLYIQLESLRLGVHLHYKKNIPENIVAEFEKIPPLILQPFVENAIWHGLSRKEGEKEIGITVSLEADWLVYDITDNGIGRAKAQELKNGHAILHQSKGIDITRKRLIDFNDDNHICPIEFFDLYDEDDSPTGTRVTIRIKRKFNTADA